MRDQKTTLVLIRQGTDTHADWFHEGAIVLNNYSLLVGALHAGVTEYGREVARVIVDRSLAPAQFLDLLSRLPMGFRGDVLLIQEDGSGYLSAISRDEGRYLYSLTPSDIRFYRDAALADGASEPSLQQPARIVSSIRFAS